MAIQQKAEHTLLSQRDYVATLLLQGMLANSSDLFTRQTMGEKDHKAKAASLAYKFADALIEASADGEAGSHEGLIPYKA